MPTRSHRPGGPPAAPLPLAARVAAGRVAPCASLCVFLLALAACRPGSPAPTNVVLVTLDTTRADHLSCYGYFRATTPAIDRLAAESLVFERCIVPMATTLPTHTSILTATYPLEHGVLANSTQGGRRFVPSDALRSFAEVARDAGRATAAFVSAAPLKRHSGIAAGFDVFDQPAGRERRAGATNAAALAWLAALGERPYFLWVHYFDAHWPYDAPAPFAGSFATDDGLEAHVAERAIPDRAPRPLVGRVEDARGSINAYDAELAYLDSEVERLLDALRARSDWDRTALLVIGDHGEGLCQHGHASHEGTWDEQLHAPLLMRVPGRAGERIDVPLSAVDALPTLLGRLDAPELAAFRDGTSGRDVLAPGAGPRAVASQDSGRDPDVERYRYALTGARWKLFRVEHADGAVGHQLFDLDADPHELRDVAAEHPGVVERLGAELERRLDEQRERGRRLRSGRAPATAPLDADTLDELRDLGYLGDG